MDASLSSLIPQVAALLAGGLTASLGLVWIARRPAVQSRLSRVGTLPFTAGCIVLAAAGSALAVWLAASSLDTAVSDPTALEPLRLLALGLSAGLPMGLPGFVAARVDARRRERERVKRRDYVPTKDDRRAYAARIVEQIVEVSPRPRRVTASIAGDGGTVLRFEGDIDATEGERLTRALRDDLRGVGFKRVEGGGTADGWWSRV